MKQSTLPIQPFLEDFARQTERIIGSIIKKKGIIISDTSQKNIVVAVVKTTTGYDVEFLYRNSLRFTSMGAGRGWSHGVKISASGYQKALSSMKSRRQKDATNRPAFARIHRLEEALALEIEDLAVNQIKQNFEDLSREQKGLIVKSLTRNPSISLANRRKFR
jgi:hypothetical protein